MRFTYSSEARAFYIYIREAEQIARTETLIDEAILINLDRDAGGNIIGVEIIHP